MLFETQGPKFWIFLAVKKGKVMWSRCLQYTLLPILCWTFWHLYETYSEEYNRYIWSGISGGLWNWWLLSEPKRNPEAAQGGLRWPKVTWGWIRRWPRRPWAAPAGGTLTDRSSCPDLLPFSPEHWHATGFVQLQIHPNPFWSIGFKPLHCTAAGLEHQGRPPYSRWRKWVLWRSRKVPKSTYEYSQTPTTADILSTSGIWSTTEMCLELLKKWGRDAVSAEGRLGHPGMSSQLLSGLLSVRPSSDSPQQHKAKQVR